MEYTVNSLNLSLSLPKDKIKIKESPLKLSETTSKPCGYGFQTSKILGPTVLLNPGSIPCSTTLSLPPTCKELSSETIKIIRSPGQSGHRGSSGGSLVEGQPSCMEWKGPSPSLARWLKELMQLAAIDTSLFKGHSIRGTVSTEAARQGFSIPDILQFADWSQQSTFIKFYYRPQFNPSAERAVLLSNEHLL